MDCLIEIIILILFLSISFVITTCTFSLFGLPLQVLKLIDVHVSVCTDQPEATDYKFVYLFNLVKYRVLFILVKYLYFTHGRLHTVRHLDILLSFLCFDLLFTNFIYLFSFKIKALFKCISGIIMFVCYFVTDLLCLSCRELIEMVSMRSAEQVIFSVLENWMIAWLLKFST